MAKERNEIIYDRFDEEAGMKIILPTKKVKKNLDEVTVGNDEEKSETSDLHE